MEVIRIGMVFAGQHLADNDAFESSAHGFNLLEGLHLQTDIGQDMRHLFGRQIDRDILLEPVVGYVHISI